MDKEYTPSNWNAGTQFNDFVIACKYQVIEAQAIRDYRVVVDTLHIDMASTKSKILKEAEKMGKGEEARKMFDQLKVNIRNCFMSLKKQLNRNSTFVLEDNIRYVTEKLFEMQGDYGLLYPFEEKDMKKKGDAIKHGFE